MYLRQKTKSKYEAGENFEINEIPCQKKGFKVYVLNNLRIRKKPTHSSSLLVSFLHT
jgi:hypothetical protein